MASYTPAILSASLSKNTATVGDTVEIFVSAADIESAPANAVYYSNEFQSGEV